MESLNFIINLKDKPNYQYNITDNIILNIIKLTYGFSLIYFTNEFNNKIPVPNDILIFEYGLTNAIYKILLNKINNEFFHLSNIYNYKIEYNNLTLDIDFKSF